METREQQGFELVAGPRQIGAVLFLLVAAIGICSALAYMAGKAAAAAARVPAAPPPIVAVTPPPPPEVVEVVACRPADEAEPNEPAKIPRQFDVSSPAPGEVFLQVAAVPRGVADIFAAGFAVRGAGAVLAPASSDAMVRVLVGPFHDREGLRKAKASLEASGFAPFVREYPSQDRMSK